MNSIGLAVAVALLIAGPPGAERVQESELGAPGTETAQPEPTEAAEQTGTDTPTPKSQTTNESPRSGRSVAAFWFVG